MMEGTIGSPPQAPSSAPSSPLSDLSTMPASSPLSVLSKSPTPPPAQSRRRKMSDFSRYPSPSSSATSSGSASPIKSDTTEEISVRMDGPPPAKRRKVAAKKERTTEYVDLENPTKESEEELDRLLRVLRKKKKIVVIAGAGISVSSGIPDFRSSTGLFKTLPSQHKMKGSGKDLFDASVYKHDSSTSNFHDMVRRMSEQISQAKPSPFHHLLASIAEEGRLLRLYTQNIDCIDTSMPPLATAVPLNNKGPWPRSIQLHGGLDKMVCSKCGVLEKFDPSLFNGPEPPSCKTCLGDEHVRVAFAEKRSHGVGKLRPRIVLYNEHNPDQDAIGNVSSADLKKGPDAVIVVGTTLKIPGVRRLVRELCQVTRSKRDGFTAWINLEPEPQGPGLKDCWDLVVKGKCDDVAQLANLPHWDEQDIGDRESYSLTDEEYVQRVKKGNPLEVEIESKRLTVTHEPHTPSAVRSKNVERILDGGIPTPSASPRVRSPAPSKSAALAKTKQSKLVFGNSAVSTAAKTKKTAAGATPAPAKPATKPTKGRKPLKSARGQPQPAKGNSLTTTFRATKNVAGGAGKQKTAKGEEKPLQENILLKGLPSLRPPQEECVDFPYEMVPKTEESLVAFEKGIGPVKS